MERTYRTVLRVVAGLTVALGLVALLFGVVGVDEVVDSLATAESAVLVGVVLVALCWLASWGVSLYVGLRILGVPTSLGRRCSRSPASCSPTA